MAFIVCTVLGLAVGHVAAVYVGGWTDGDADTITAAQAAIHGAARGLLADLENHTYDDEGEGTAHEDAEREDGGDEAG